MDSTVYSIKLCRVKIWEDVTEMERLRDMRLHNENMIRGYHIIINLTIANLSALEGTAMEFEEADHERQAEWKSLVQSARRWSSIVAISWDDGCDESEVLKMEECMKKAEIHRSEICQLRERYKHIVTDGPLVPLGDALEDLVRECECECQDNIAYHQLLYCELGERLKETQKEVNNLDEKLNDNLRILSQRTDQNAEEHDACKVQVRFTDTQ
jgi:hypothetical protein